MPNLPQMSVSFDQTVSFITVPPLYDICPQYPESVFYNQHDFAVMTAFAIKDAEEIKQITKSKSSTKKLLTLCDLGIEHRTCTAKERFDREVKARAVILTVLRAQKRYRCRCSASNYDYAQVEIDIAKASANASKEAVLRARERAAQLEGQCSSSRKTGSSKQKRRISWTAFF